MYTSLQPGWDLPKPVGIILELFGFYHFHLHQLHFWSYTDNGPTVFWGQLEKKLLVQHDWKRA